MHNNSFTGKLSRILPAVVVICLGLSGCGSGPITVTTEPSPEASAASSPSPVAETQAPSGPVLLWSDEFDSDGLPDGSIWGYDTGGSGWGNNELEYYTENRSENASVRDGKLIITAIREPYKTREYTSARLVTWNKKSIQYGRIEVSAKLPVGKGTWPAIWLLPTVNSYGDWPKSGEIDIMEHVGFDQGIIHFTLHSGKYNWQKGNQITDTVTVPDCSDAFHKYAIEWRPTSIDFYIDDQKLFETKFDPGKDGYEGSNAWPFNKPFYLILNLAVGGNWGGQNGVDDSIFPQSMEVDYVRVYDLGNHPEGDVNPPTQVTGIRLNNSPAGYYLSWRVSTDNFAVDRYEVMIDGKLYITVRAPSLSISELKEGDTHEYIVVSIDTAGNRTESEPVTLTASR